MLMVIISVAVRTRDMAPPGDSRMRVPPTMGNSSSSWVHQQQGDVCKSVALLSWGANYEVMSAAKAGDWSEAF